ncbi:hypothetical protein MGYG_08487 [Nannizzia gypsea CBS 118893]|uniref:GED domain-containing protein n=1 Tax=Arthroderma gypseum (strain ATCC MYA-4604 / CBS 118893) TaxID=535722 RepID=E4V5U9_ARTGP|nr:hypothetical protein MGYG_08487 [Nannizzia gypsea CBS 118893]EFR05474.1 hypothetical protein MGYG_08487 [Nannizzia gypsea CBS 118893]
MGQGIRHFVGVESSKQLAFVDDLYKLGVNTNIELPELVVVGDQSTGKSSVLQAITEVSFPVDETMCTRFPIKISFRQTRVKKTTIRATIFPGPVSQFDDALTSRTKLFLMEREELNPKAMKEIVEEASRAIFGEKQSSPSKPNGHTTSSSQLMLSDATLYIERSGPDEMHWTIIDLPGLIENRGQGQDGSTAADKRLRPRTNATIAEGLVRTYLSNERNIVIVVADPVDVERQRIFRLIEEIPGLQERSIGVLTKCDRKQETSDKWMIKLLRNELSTVCHLKHGWFGLRNRTPKESGISDAERDEKEAKMFSKEEWAGVPRDRTGIKSLMAYVDRERRSQLQKSIPHILHEIREKLQGCEAELEKLGKERTTPLAQQLYVQGFCNDMQKMADAALRGRYEDIPSDSLEAMLRFNVQKHLDKFSKDMRTATMALHFTCYHQDLINLKHASSDPTVWEALVETADGLYSEIWKEAQICQAGSLPGSIHPNIEENIFRKQSAHWERISRELVEKVRDSITGCYNILLKIAIPEEETRKEVNRAIEKDVEAWSRQIDAALTELVNDNQKLRLSTYNPIFMEEYQYADRQRGEILLQEPAVQDDTDTEKTSSSSTAEAKDSGYATPKSGGPGSISTKLSIILYVRARLESYYRIALNRFVDNVAMQVVERHALGPSCPIRTVSAGFFLQLSCGELEAIAGERNFARRAELQQEQSQYQKALKNWREFNQNLY